MDPEQKPSTFQQQQQSNNIQETQEDTFIRIVTYLKEKNVQIQTMQHEPTRTSEQAAKIRDTPLEWGSKTMLVKGASQYGNILLIYRANMKVSWKKLRKVPQIGKKAQMANEEDVLKLGVKPGGVPPFPHLIGIKGILDKKFLDVDTMAFNAGHKCKSIIMKTQQYPIQDIVVQDITED